MTLNIYATQLYSDDASKFAAFTHVFNQYLHAELSREIVTTSETDHRILEGWTLIFRFVIFPNDEAVSEVKGPQVFRKTKDLEFGVHIRGMTTRRDVFDTLMSLVLSQCRRLGLDTAKIEKKLPTIRQYIMDNQTTMFFEN